MRQLANTLYITSENAYAALKNENILVMEAERVLGEVPLHTLENIIYFGYKGLSPALLGECAKRSIGICLMNQRGRFLARICGKSSGNVLLRKQQYRLADSESESCLIARCFIAGKIYNSRSVLARMNRDHPLSLDAEQFRLVSSELKHLAKRALSAAELPELLGIEGDAAKKYFSLFDAMILQNKPDFCFQVRAKRPPTDRVNALLSFAYTLLAHDCANALESVGLDAYVGFLHRDRPGRESLALDLMEELRSIYADKFVLSLINNRIMKAGYFQYKENGAVWLDESGRKIFLQEWQKKKKDVIKHPFLQEKIPWGLVPYVQALLLARLLRGDLEEYPAFLWK